jgi:hypothetical protein
LIINIEEYVNNRMKEHSKLKTETLNWLSNVTKTVSELTKDEEMEILEKKMIYYSVSGALEELVRLKRFLDR